MTAGLPMDFRIAKFFVSLEVKKQWFTYLASKTVVHGPQRYGPDARLK